MCLCINGGICQTGCGREDEYWALLEKWRQEVYPSWRSAESIQIEGDIVRLDGFNLLSDSDDAEKMIFWIPDLSITQNLIDFSDSSMWVCKNPETRPLEVEFQSTKDYTKKTLKDRETCLSVFWRRCREAALKYNLDTGLVARSLFLPKNIPASIEQCSLPVNYKLKPNFPLLEDSEKAKLLRESAKTSPALRSALGHLQFHITQFHANMVGATFDKASPLGLFTVVMEFSPHCPTELVTEAKKKAHRQAILISQALGLRPLKRLRVSPLLDKARLLLKETNTYELIDELYPEADSCQDQKLRKRINRQRDKVRQHMQRRYNIRR